MPASLSFDDAAGRHRGLRRHADRLARVEDSYRGDRVEVARRLEGVRARDGVVPRVRGRDAHREPADRRISVARGALQARDVGSGAVAEVDVAPDEVPRISSVERGRDGLRIGLVQRQRHVRLRVGAPDRGLQLRERLGNAVGGRDSHQGVLATCGGEGVLRRALAVLSRDGDHGRAVLEVVGATRDRCSPSVGRVDGEGAHTAHGHVHRPVRRRGGTERILGLGPAAVVVGVRAPTGVRHGGVVHARAVHGVGRQLTGGVGVRRVDRG